MQQHIVTNPRYEKIGRLFGDRGFFEIPKYQRAYAWEAEHIEDFLLDLSRCYDARRASQPREHFFGGLVCVEQDVPGTGLIRREVVDGQQRLATFALYVSRLIQLCGRLAEATHVDEVRTFFTSRASQLQDQFLVLEDMVNMQPKVWPKLALSTRDQDLFDRLVSGQEVQLTKKSPSSHHRLLKAVTLIDSHFDSLTRDLSEDAASEAVERLVEVLNGDCTTIYIPTTSRPDAYRLFQVLNDRGETLSAGDLLRAATLELLEGNALSKCQSEAEKLWDKILIDPPELTDKFLQWYFAARQGKRARPSSLFDDFMAVSAHHCHT